MRERNYCVGRAAVAEPVERGGVGEFRGWRVEEDCRGPTVEHRHRSKDRQQEGPDFDGAVWVAMKLEDRIQQRTVSSRHREHVPDSTPVGERVHCDSQRGADSRLRPQGADDVSDVAVRRSDMAWTSAFTSRCPGLRTCHVHLHESALTAAGTQPCAGGLVRLITAHHARPRVDSIRPQPAPTQDASSKPQSPDFRPRPVGSV